MTIVADIIDEDFTTLDDWYENGSEFGVVVIDPAGQARFDTNEYNDGNSTAVIDKGGMPKTSYFGDEFTIEIETYFDAIGTYADVDYFLSQLYISEGYYLNVYFCSDCLKMGIQNHDPVIIGDVVKCNAQVELQTWRFEVTRSTSEATVYLNNISLGTFLLYVPA